MTTQIKVRYSSIDGCRETRNFKSLAGARKFAVRAIGAHPEMGSSYAVSGDGIGKITVTGVSLRDLFFDAPVIEEPQYNPYDYCEDHASNEEMAAWYHAPARQGPDSTMYLGNWTKSDDDLPF